MMGKTKATEGICKEIGTLFSRVPTWKLSKNRTQKADWDTNEAISFFLFSVYLICLTILFDSNFLNLQIRIMEHKNMKSKNTIFRIST